MKLSLKNAFLSTFFMFLSLTILTLVPLGCSMMGDGQSRMTVTLVKPQETLFTVIETEDPEYPTLAASIRLPFRVNSDNTVVLVEKHAYLTTERHLHVIDLSIPQRPVYLTTLAFADELGKVLPSGNFLVLATRKTIHLVDISYPSSPVLHSTTQLPYPHAIKDIDVHDRHLYVIGENDTLYIFHTPRGQAQLIKAVELEKRRWLLCKKVVCAEIEQIPLSTSNMYPSGIARPLLSGNEFLQLQSSQGEKIRSSSEFLGVERLKNPTTDIQIYDACREDDHKISISVSDYNMEWEYREHLATIGEKYLTRRNPTLTYRVGELGEVQQIAEDTSSETIDINAKSFMGPVTDFDISEAHLSVVHAKGVFAIFSVVSIEKSHKGAFPELLSVTPLQASRPISIAIEQDYACVLAVSRVSQR